MTLPWQPNGMRFQANMGLGGPTYQAPPPTDPRTQYTGGLSYTAPQAYGQAGNTNNANSRPMLGPQSSSVSSQLGPYPAFSGYQNMNPVQNVNPTFSGTVAPETWFQHPTNGMVMQPFKQTSPAVSIANKLPGAPAPTPKPPEPTRGFWGGGFGQSDNSAWGNALGPTLEQQVGRGALQSAPNQPSGHVNQALPPGYGSVFGLGGGSK